jgi:hypothetical protein
MMTKAFPEKNRAYTLETKPTVNALQRRNELRIQWMYLRMHVPNSCGDIALVLELDTAKVVRHPSDA